jgi:hypothetical protein
MLFKKLPEKSRTELVTRTHSEYNAKAVRGALQDWLAPYSPESGSVAIFLGH